jgi:hypothetical protein
MKLDIINFNPNINQDKETLKNLILIFENINQNISTKKYLPYQNILNKLSRFMNMIGQSFEKDLTRVKEEENYFDETNDDDDISISSISEYEYDPSDDEIEIRIEEDELIKKFEKINKIQFSKTYDRFDFEYE